MACLNCKKKPVWKFTNKTQICENCFARYFDKKVLSTIRAYQMPVSKIKKNDLKSKVINRILQGIILNKRNGRLSNENINDISNKIVYEMMNSRRVELKKFFPKNHPLYFLSDKEILLYSKVKKIKGNLKKIQKRFLEADSFIRTLEEKNRDIRQNIINAVLKAG